MRISECYFQIRGSRDCLPYIFTNKHFDYTVHMYTKEWTIIREFYKDGQLQELDNIPDKLFAAMMQNDEWKLQENLNEKIEKNS